MNCPEWEEERRRRETRSRHFHRYGGRGNLHRPGDSATSPSLILFLPGFLRLFLFLLFHPFLSSFLRDPSSSFALHEGSPHSHFTRVGMLLGAVVRHETEEEEEEGSHSRFFSLLLLLLLVSLLT